MLDIVDPATFDDEIPAGTGPFKVTDYDAGNSIDLVRHDESWRASDNIAELTQAIPDPTTLSSAMQTGEVDVAFGLPADVSTQLESKGFTTINKSAGSAAINSLIADVEPKLADVRVRQAINHAIDREAFVEGALGGFGTPNGSQLLQEGYFGYDPELPHYEYDLDKAKALIKEADAEGLELPIATTALFKGQAEAVAGFLNAAGFESEVVIEDLVAFFATAMGSSKYPLLYWQTDYYELRDIASVVRFGPTGEGQQPHIEEGTVEAIFDNPQHPYTRGLLASRPVLTTSRRRLPALGGRPPAPGSWPPGCGFLPRCAAATDACSKPPPIQENPHGWSRCFHPGSDPIESQEVGA